MSRTTRKPTLRERLCGIHEVRLTDGRVTGWTTTGVGPLRYRLLTWLKLWAR